MYTDRELMELAAKAAGMDYLIWTPGDVPIVPPSARPDRKRVTWNPLTDDGDAFRLAVKLGLACSPGTQVYTNNDDLMGAWADRDVMYGTDLYQQVEWSKSTGDPYAATRRAVVRAAAEIGQGIAQPTPDSVLEDNYYKTQAEAFGYGRGMK